MDQNDFTGFLPTSSVAVTPLLVNLDMSGNTIDGKLPSDLFGLSDLEFWDRYVCSL
jgi:hypothetical protein